MILLYDPVYMILKSAYKDTDSYVRFKNVMCQEVAEGEDGGRKHREKRGKKKKHQVVDDILPDTPPCCRHSVFLLN
jgi:hypothetical protein